MTVKELVPPVLVHFEKWHGRAGSPAEHLGWGANPAGVLVPPVNHAQDARATNL